MLLSVEKKIGSGNQKNGRIVSHASVFLNFYNLEVYELFWLKE